MRTKVILICEVCVSRNYTTTRSKSETERLQLKKFCRHCNATTIHKESR
ncbi:50S ribosomal protein L33 [[Mycoplasma] testudinis]|nr:50S ribosomal protein L33 [[Mycoplasma] testudinis]